MLTFHSKGDFSKSFKYLNKLDNISKKIDFEAYGKKGIQALVRNTPRDSGLLESSWSYIVKRNTNSIEIVWNNKDIEGGCNVAILVQYGHATKSGTYIKGVDFINPAMRPIFEEIANDVWKEVTRA